MSLAEGVQARVAYKAYASGVITSNAEAVSASDLGASSAQILRRVASTLNMTKDTYQSNEILSSRQISDFRHGIRRATGNVSGEFSPGTYEELLEAAFRGTWEAALSGLDETDFTSVAADNSDSRFTFTAGDPVALGIRVGHILQFTGLSEAANNSTNYVVVAMGGTSNREVTVYPAPTDMGADSEFDVVSIGKRLIVPSTGHVNRKFGFEIYNEDIDVARLFTECRVGGFNIQLPATGLATIEIPVLGRNMETYTAGDAPFFTSPTAATTTGIFAAVNGLLRVEGVNVGVVTGLNVQMDMSPSSDAVVGQNFAPEIYNGRANVTGQITALFEDTTLINYFKNETEIDVLAYLTTSSAVNTPAVTILMPRVKLGGADVQTSGEASQPITMPFQALLSTATEASTGIPATTIQICDTQA